MPKTFNRTAPSYGKSHSLTRMILREMGNLLTVQMSEHKTVLLIPTRYISTLAIWDDCVLTLIYQGTCNDYLHPGSSLKQRICSFRNKHRNEQPEPAFLPYQNKGTLVDSVGVCYSCKRRHLSSSQSKLLIRLSYNIPLLGTDCDLSQSCTTLATASVKMDGIRCWCKRRWSSDVLGPLPLAQG